MKCLNIKIPPNTIFRHTKTGNHYLFLMTAQRESDKEAVVVYTACDVNGIRTNESVPWVRPLVEFVEKFKGVKQNTNKAPILSPKASMLRRAAIAIRHLKDI